MEDYKEETRKTYNKYPELFDEKFGKYFGKEIKDKADFFLEELKGRKIVDLGSGPGNHAEYFKEKGFDVLCVDISEEMVKLCRKKGLKAEVMDIEDLKLPEKTFDGVWAYTSLLHMPKSKIKNAIKNIHKILKQDGVLSVSLIEGSGEGFEVRDYHPETKRWFSYYNDEEIKGLFGRNFNFMEISSNTSDSKTRPGVKYKFLTYLFRPK